MGLGKVNAVGAQLLPEVGDGIQADIAGPGGHVAQNDLDIFQQHVGVGEVDVDLIGAEGTPHMLDAIHRF